MSPPRPRHLPDGSHRGVTTMSRWSSAIDGRRCCGVLEQSWRIGGASPAEIVALEAFRAEPSLHAVRASCIEVYGDNKTPPDAVVHFTGVDDRVGPMTKYTLVAAYDHSR